MTDLKFSFTTKVLISSYYEANRFSVKTKQLTISTKGTIPEGYHLYSNNCLFLPPIYTSPWWESYLLPRQIEVQLGENTSIILSSKEKLPTLAGKKHLSVHFFLHGLRSSIFRRKKYGSIPSVTDINMVIPAPTNIILTYTKDQRSLNRRKITKEHRKMKERHEIKFM